MASSSSCSCGPMHCMPLIVINLGGEMVYILEQRLCAQSVGNEKSKKVLQDVLRTMYSPKFIRELFKPQEMYSSASTREIFNKLAHSSIMRLNESSMDKLYDLMTMGFKHQLLQCTYPAQMLHVTINHLNILKTIAGDSDNINLLIDAALHLAFETYGNMSAGDWLQLRQGLFTFVQGRKIKVSLFLQNNLQNLDGSFVLSTQGAVPMGSQVPGTIRYYDEEGGAVDYQSSFETPAADGCTPFQTDYHTPLGMNLYAKDLGKQIHMTTMKPPACAAADVARALALQVQLHAPESATADAMAAGRLGGGGGSSSSAISMMAGTKRLGGASSNKGGGSSATAELNLLAELLGSAAKSTAEDDDEEEGDHGDDDGADGGGRQQHHHRILKPFKINLFPEDPFEDSGSLSSSSEGKVETVVLDATSQRKTAASMLHDLRLGDDDDHRGAKTGYKAAAGKVGSKGDDDDGNDADGDDDDDLLDLMDSAK